MARSDAVAKMIWQDQADIEALAKSYKTTPGVFLRMVGNAMASLGKEHLADEIFAIAAHADVAKKNPVLTIYNPLVKPATGIIGEAEELRYTYKGEPYKHPFDSQVRILGILGPKPMQRRDLLITGVEGQPMWATQAEVDAGKVVA
jgi:hypothetical protein